MLKFSPANAKLQKLGGVKFAQKYLGYNRKIYSLDLLAGHSCPNAHNCLSKVVDGKIVDGKHSEFRCYAASLEVIFTAKFRSDKHNFDSLRGLSFQGMVDLISKSIPKNLGICRIHSSGDMFSETYFKAWLEVARQNPDKLFYAYTKSLSYWIKNRQDVPSNMILTASYGGRLDHLIETESLRSAKVVFSTAEAKRLRLPIEHTDEHAANPRTSHKSFCLILHGIQKAGSNASKALELLKKNGANFSYSRK